MADKSTELERIYTVPLRKAKHGTRSKRANRAIRDVRAFMERHMKGSQVWIDNEVNEALWSRGKFTIPSKIRVRAVRFDDGVVEVTLPDADASESQRSAIEKRQEAAAETPILAPAGMDDLEGLEGDEGDDETDGEPEVSDEAEGDAETVVADAGGEEE